MFAASRDKRRVCAAGYWEGNNMRIALASARLADRDVAFNLSQMTRFMRMAKEQGAELVCFGESFLQGFETSLTWSYEQDRDVAISTDSQVFGDIAGLSREIGIDVLFGFVERSGDALYSSCALIADGALRHVYRRISRGWKEYWHTDEHYREGDLVEVFHYRGKRCLIALCGDLWDYPERFRLDEDVLFWPVYISFTPEEWRNGMAEEYAAQAKLACEYALLCNSIGEGGAYGGAAAFRNGQVADQIQMEEEGLLIVEA